MAYPRKWLTSSIAGGVALGLVVGFAVKATSGDDGDGKTNVETGTTVVAPDSTVAGETTVTAGPGGETTVTTAPGETTVTTIVATTPLPPPASVDTLPVATSRRRPRPTTTVPPTAPPPTQPPTTPFVTPPALPAGS